VRGLFMSPIVIARDLSFEFPNGRELFEQLNFSLAAGRTALVGPNGIGKSCLAALISGESEPTAGSVRRHGCVKLIRQRELPPSCTVAEFLAAAYEWSLLGDALLRGIDDSSLCTQLSGGQWMRVRLARALSADFLILDEPTNDLDREARAAVLHFLRIHKSGVLVISHDEECLALCEDVLELSNQGLERFSGGWADYLEAKEAEAARLNQALERAKRERERAAVRRIEQRERQERRNRRGAATAARGGQPRILLGSLQQRAELTTTRLDAVAFSKANDAVRASHQAFAALKVDPVMYSDAIGSSLPAQKLVAEAEGFNIRQHDWLYPTDLDFSWRGNLRLAVKGANGSGKSTLLRAVLGDQFTTRGELRRGELTHVYIDQQRSALNEDESVFDNVRAVSSDSDIELRNRLARFLFVGDAVFQSVRTLSGGERLRASLARGLLGAQQPELLMLDEPTNNLDRANVEFLANVVRDFQGAVIVVSHDEHFLRRCRIDEEMILERPTEGLPNWPANAENR